MATCLVKKLKGSVNNPYLRTLYSLDLQASVINNPQEAQQSCKFIVSAETTITIIGDGYVADTLAGLANMQKSYTFNGTKTLFFSNGNYVVRISDRRNLTEYRELGQTATPCVVHSKLSDLTLCDNLNYILVKKPSSGSLSEIGLAATKINLYGDTFSGNISSLADRTDITTLILQSPNITGDIAVLGGLEKPTNITTANSSIEGEATDLFEALAGSTSRSYSMTFNFNGIITLNGEVIANNTSKTVAFDGQGGYTIS